MHECLLFWVFRIKEKYKRKSRNAFFLRTLRHKKEREIEIKTTMETQKDWIGKDIEAKHL